MSTNDLRGHHDPTTHRPCPNHGITVQEYQCCFDCCAGCQADCPVPTYLVDDVEREREASIWR